MVVSEAIHWGLDVRQWAWDSTYESRFKIDLGNAYARGSEAASPDVGYYNLYTKDANSQSLLHFLRLDYPPLRLLIVTEWAKWTQRRFPGVASWHADYVFNAPLLWLNTFCELAMSIGLGVLVWLWVRRRVRADFLGLENVSRDGRETQNGARGSREMHDRPGEPRERHNNGGRESSADISRPPNRRAEIPWATPVLLGVLAGLLAWFNPAVIYESHVWPQWEAWMLPFCVFAMLAGSVELWWIAGACIAIGAMLKGQMLIGAPVLFLWPLMLGNWRGFLRSLTGFAFTLLGYAGPWLVRAKGIEQWTISWKAIAWVICALVAGLLIYPLKFSRQQKIATRIIIGAIAFALAIWPIVWSVEKLSLIVIAGIALLIVIANFLPVREISGRKGMGSLAVWLSGSIAIGLGLCPLIGGNMDWWKIGFQRGTVQYMAMHVGPTPNLASILSDEMGWSSPLETVEIGPWDVPLRTLTLWIYGLTLVLCAAAAAMHQRRNDPRALIALTTPWLVMFAVLTQMHERYLVFAAALMTVTVAVSFGLTLLNLLITALAWITLMPEIPAPRPPWLEHLLRSAFPDTGWLTLLLAAIFLWVSIVPRRKRVRPPAPNQIDSRKAPSPPFAKLAPQPELAAQPQLLPPAAEVIA